MSDRRQDEPRRAALAGLKVIDLAGPFGNYSGKLFRDLGAEVILVEPRGGARGRTAPPLAANGLGLRFAYENAGKRSIALDLPDHGDRDVFLGLIAQADLLIESEKPGTLAAMGLGYLALAERRPELVVASISGFGQSGPYADWEADDIVAMALSGMMSLAGYPDSSPLAPYGFQAEASAHLFAATSSLAALLLADLTGVGEHVDVSMQECMVMGLENAAQFVDLESIVRRRDGGEQPRAGSGVFACKDGHVYLMSAGVGANRFWQNTICWLEAGGADTGQLAGARWEQDGFLATDEARSIFQQVFTAFSMPRTKEELYLSGQRHRVPIAPVQAPADVLNDAQLRHRRFFQPLPEGVGAHAVAMPGAPYKLSATPWTAGRHVPACDEYGAEIRRGLASSDPSRLSVRRAS